ncbi:hypothetical protein CA13_48520 [Planctomycetes bacterium CA13]|uniref:Uncharacterized protein n=1 Tax=Novipirellula herctigrandis TaxID=2527986 RepID=A0A5C5Z8F2_9BACT|nr:hypothetical protein CA13_48520 [Planctomycetes bacterium CA13]
MLRSGFAEKRPEEPANCLCKTTYSNIQTEIHCPDFAAEALHGVQSRSDDADHLAFRVGEGTV